MAQQGLAPDTVRVRVRAAALNRADVGIYDRYRSGASKDKPGGEWAGDVLEIGSAVTHVRPGDRAMGLGPMGFQREAVIDRCWVLPMPDRLDYIQATVLPAGLMTMHNALATHGHVGSNTSVLIQGATAGVGVIGLQIAKLLGASQIIATTRRTDRHALLTGCGADTIVVTAEPDWPARVLAATNDRGADVIVDLVSGPGFIGLLACVALKGRIVNVGRLGGSMGSFDFDLHARKRIEYVGVTFRTRSRDEIQVINNETWRDLGPALARGEIAVPIDRVMPLAEWEKAIEIMRNDDFFGKIALSAD